MAGPPGQRLFEHFVVCGLPSSGLVTLNGEQGYVGTDAAYRPCCIDSMPYYESPDKQPPPQLPLCCMPEGVCPVPRNRLQPGDLLPRAYPIVLTEGDATKVYVSCLVFYDELPQEVLVAHPDLLGHLAPKALCLVTHQPYLATGRRILQQLYTLVFCWGLEVPLAQLVEQVLQVPAPTAGGPPVVVQLGPSYISVPPPLSSSSKALPPPGECCLGPLLEALPPDQLVALFVAVLLERRVLLRAKHLWLLTAAAECVVRLLYPFPCPPTYIPVVPSSWTEFLEAPTVFLMGVCSSQPLEPRVLEGLVVVDLDAGRVEIGADAALAACLAHAHVVDLRTRLRAVLRPLSCMGELVGEPGDSLVMAGLQLPSHPVTGPAREALVGQIFLEFFRTALYKLSHCCSRGRSLSTFSAAGDSLNSTPRLFRLTSRSTSSSINLLAAINAAAVMEQAGHSSSGSSVAVDKDKWIAYQTERRGLSAELHRQLVDTVGLEQVAARVFCEGDHEGWYKQGLVALRECQEAEEKLLRTAGQVSAGAHLVSTPQRLQLLQQPPLVATTLPPLLVWGNQSAAPLSSSAAAVKRRSSVARGKAPKAGRRRALSELTGSSSDRLPPVAGASDDTLVGLFSSAPRQTSPSTSESLLSITMPAPRTSNLGPLLGPGGFGAASAASDAAGTSAAGEFLREAELVRQQSMALLLLVTAPVLTSSSSFQARQPQQSTAASAPGLASGRRTTGAGVIHGWHEPLSQALEAARQLLAVQTGNNSWFLTTRLQEMLNNPTAAVAAGAAAAAAALSGTAAGAAAAAAPGSRGAPGAAAGKAQLSSTSSSPSKGLPGKAQDADSDLEGPQLSSKSVIVSSGRAVTRALAASGLAAGYARKLGGNGKQQSPGRHSPEPSEVTRSAKSAVAVLGMATTVPPSAGGGAGGRRPSTVDGQIKGSAGSPVPGPRRSTTGSPPPPAAAGNVIRVLPAPHAMSAVDLLATADAAARGQPGTTSRQSPLQQQQQQQDGVGTSRSYRRLHTLPTPAASAVVSSPGEGPRSSSMAGAGAGAACSPAGQQLAMTAPITTAPAGEAATLFLALPPSRFAWSGGDAAAGSEGGASSSPAKGQQQQQQQQQRSSTTGMAQLERRCCLVSNGSWRVLADMMGRMLSAAAAGEDWQQVNTVLSLCSQICCRPVGGGPELLLLRGLASQSLVYVPWFWSSAFMAALATAAAGQEARHLQKQHQQQQQDGQERGTAPGAAEEPKGTCHNLLAACAAEFAVYMAGVGLPACSAWRVLGVLQQQAQDAGHQQLPAATQVHLRAHLGHQCHLAAAAAGLWPGPSCWAPARVPSAAPASAAGASWSLPLHHQQQQVASPFQQASSGRSSASSGMQRRSATAVVPGTTSSAWAGPLLGAKRHAGGGAQPTPALCDSRADQAQQDTSSGGAPGTAGHVSWAATAAAGAEGLEGAVAPAAASTGSRPSTPQQVKRQQSHSAAAGPSRPRLACQASSTRSRTPSPSKSRAALLESSGSAAADAAATSLGSTSPAAAAGSQWLGGCCGSSSLQHPGAVQYGQLHTAPVAALAAANLIVLTAGYDGTIKVLNARERSLELYAAMPAPRLAAAWSTRCQRHLPPPLAAQLQQPVVALAEDASRAVVGNAGAAGSSLWILDIHGGTPALELHSGAISGVHLLERNPHSLLATTAGSASSSSSSGGSSSGSRCTTVCLWDTRQAAAGPGLVMECKGSSAAARQLKRSTGSFAPSATTTTSSSSSAKELRRSQSSSGRSNSTLSKLAGLLGRSSSSKKQAQEGGSPGKLQQEACGGALGPAACTELTPGAGLACLTAAEGEGLVAAGGSDGSMYIWDVRQGSAPLASCMAHEAAINHLAFTHAEGSSSSSSSSLVVVSGSADWTVRTWDVHANAVGGTCVGLGGAVTSLTLVNAPSARTSSSSSSSKAVLAGAADGSIGMWRLGGELVWLEQGHAAAVLAVAAGSHPASLVTGAANLSGAVWTSSASTGSSSSSSSSPPLDVLGPSSTVTSAAGSSGEVQQWRLAHKQALRGRVTCCSVDGGGQLLVSGLRDGRVLAWNYSGLW